jgi:sugar phosphate isomerase/epimerase
MEDKCRLLKDLGYAGMELRLNAKELPGNLEQLDKHGLRAVAVYAPSWLEEPLSDELAACIKLLAGRDTRIEMPIRSRNKLKPSDAAGDQQAVALLKAASDLCADTGPVVSIYPHAGCWTERTEDGLRLAEQIQRKNMGTNFNLVHWQWVKPSPSLAGLLAKALPHLFLVTINGLKGPEDTRQEIRPLDDSDYDLQGFVRILDASGYRGPVGLQCYKVAELPAVHLKRSMAVWQKLTTTTDP